MWEALTWLSKVSNYETELTVYRLCIDCKAGIFPCLFGVVRFNIVYSSSSHHWYHSRAHFQVYPQCLDGQVQTGDEPPGSVCSEFVDVPC